MVLCNSALQTFFAGLLAGSLGSLGAFWVLMGASWVAPGYFLGASWGVPAELLGGSWALLPPDALQDYSSVMSLP